MMSPTETLVTSFWRAACNHQQPKASPQPRNWVQIAVFSMLLHSDIHVWQDTQDRDILRLGSTASPNALKLLAVKQVSCTLRC